MTYPKPHIRAKVKRSHLESALYGPRSKRIHASYDGDVCRALCGVPVADDWNIFYVRSPSRLLHNWAVKSDELEGDVDSPFRHSCLALVCERCKRAKAAR